MARTTFKTQVAKVTLVSFQKDSYSLDGYYYNYRIVMAPLSDNSGKVSAAVYTPGTSGTGPAVWQKEVTKRIFNRALVEAVSFIKNHYKI